MNHGAVALVTLVKPPHNLIDAALTGGIVAAYDRAVAERKRCTLLRSGMRRFCAGGGCSPSVISQVSESNLAISVVRSTAEFADTDWAAEGGVADDVDDRAGGGANARATLAIWRCISPRAGRASVSGRAQCRHFARAGRRRRRNRGLEITASAAEPSVTARGVRLANCPAWN